MRSIAPAFLRVLLTTLIVVTAHQSLVAGETGAAGNRATAAPSMIVAVHSPSWDINFGPGSVANYGDMPVDSIDFSVMTHYVAFAAGLTSTGQMSWGGNFIGERRKPLNDRAHAAGKPVLLCMGGWGSDGNFASAMSPANRQTTINTILSTVRTYEYDGIDWDWEPFSVSDSANLFPTIRALYDSFQTMQAYYDPSKKPIQTADVNPAGGSGQANAWKQVAQYLDFVMLMSYDKMGTWSEMVYFDYAPYSRIDNVIVDRIPGGGQEMATAQRQALQMTGAGFPASKVVVGMDFMAGMARGGSGTWAGGATWPRQRWSSAPSFSADYKFDQFYDEFLDTASAAIRHWDDTAKSYFLSIDKPGDADDRFIGYAGGPGQDSTMYYHIKLAGELAIGGIMIWDLSESYLGTGRFPNSSYPNLDRNWLTNSMRKYIGHIEPPPPPPPPPRDSIPPTINLVRPLNGDSLTGTVLIEASATDNAGLGHVRFLLDGAALGAQDNSAPYTLSWNTDPVADGSHTLSAVARDLAGLEARKDITVWLTSPAPPPPDSIPPADTVTATLKYDRLFVDFGSVGIGDEKTDSVRVINDNDFSVEVSDVRTTSGRFTAQPDRMSIGPKSSRKMYVTFTPDRRGTETDLVITISGVVTRIDTVRLRGNGARRSKSRYSRGIIVVKPIKPEESATDSFYVSNDGDLPLDLNSVTTTDAAIEVTPASAVIQPNDSLLFRLSITPINGKPISGYVVITSAAGATDSIGVEVDVVNGTTPEGYALSQNYPNPFNPETKINYTLPSQSYVRMTVYNIYGQEIAILRDGVEDGGYREISWNGMNRSGASLPSGAYFLTIEAVDLEGAGVSFTQTRRMLLLR